MYQNKINYQIRKLISFVSQPTPQPPRTSESFRVPRGRNPCGSEPKFVFVLVITSEPAASLRNRYGFPMLLGGKILAFTPPAHGQTRDRQHAITNLAQLEDFCREFVKKPLDSFFQMRSST